MHVKSGGVGTPHAATVLVAGGEEPRQNLATNILSMHAQLKGEKQSTAVAQVAGKQHQHFC